MSRRNPANRRPAARLGCNVHRGVGRLAHVEPRDDRGRGGDRPGSRRTWSRWSNRAPESGSISRPGWSFADVARRERSRTGAVTIQKRAVVSPSPSTVGDVAASVASTMKSRSCGKFYEIVDIAQSASRSTGPRSSRSWRGAAHRRRSRDGAARGIRRAPELPDATKAISSAGLEAAHPRHAMAIYTGWFDRSPCGHRHERANGPVARARRMTLDQTSSTVVHGPRFVGAASRDAVAVSAAVIPTITGSGLGDGLPRYLLDPADPFPAGFNVMMTASVGREDQVDRAGRRWHPAQLPEAGDPDCTRPCGRICVGGGDSAPAMADRSACRATPSRAISTWSKEAVETVRNKASGVELADASSTNLTQIADAHRRPSVRRIATRGARRPNTTKRGRGDEIDTGQKRGSRPDRANSTIWNSTPTVARARQVPSSHRG